MATPGERFKQWVDSFAVEVKGRLHNWMADWAAKGVKNLFDDLEPGLRDQVRGTWNIFRELEGIPEELKAAGDKALEEKSFMQFVYLALMVVGLCLMPFMSSVSAYGQNMLYSVQRKLEIYRLDPATLISIWLRDKDKYEKFWEDLKDQGYSEDRVDIFKELAKAIPPLSDMVRFADFSAFDPEVLARWPEYATCPDWLKEPFALVGIKDEWADKYWFSHFVQPGRYELGEMHRRGLIGDDDVKLAYKTMGYSDYWQDLLLELVKAVPTRVDVRRWWDMRTIDEARLREVYHAQGYYGKDLDDYVLWTKVYVAFPDLLARWKNGYITEDEVKSELTTLGMPADRVDELMETNVKAVKSEKTTAERELTKTDIIKGVKTGVITREEAVEFLMDLNYDEDGAVFLLDVNIPADETEPVVKQRELTKTDIINGLKTKIITEDEARTRLLELRYSPGDADFLLKIYRAVISPPTEPRDKEASKADILLAVKKGLITPEDGYLMLLDLGFTPEAAQFILAVRAESSPFSPVSYSEFKDLTHKYRIASGMEAKEMPEELKKAADEVVRLTNDVAALKQSIEEEERGLIKVDILPAEATARRDELRVTLHRAEAELERVKSEYDRRIAEWRHGK